MTDTDTTDLVARLRSYAKDQGGWHAIDETCEGAADAIERLMKERDMVGGILCVIHRDGGHYIEEHGWEKAADDAHDVWAKLMLRAEDAEARIAKLEAALRSVEVEAVDLERRCSKLGHDRFSDQAEAIAVIAHAALKEPT